MVFGLPDGKKDEERIEARMRKRFLPTMEKDSDRRKRLENQTEKRKRFRFGRVFRYTHMPEILPRLRAIGEKFGHFAHLLALVFRSARLLPESHPMLNPANIGRFGLTDVIATAANNLVLKRENMDQILIFGAVVTALLMILVQAFLIAMHSIFGNSAQAADTSSLFTTPNPQSDLVMQFLGQVFGFRSIFDSPASVDQPGLYAILGLYSTAMMVIAVIIVVYYVITVVGESAQTGQPFGKRFNGLWAPIRLVLALGLLVPLGGGINAAQYLTLYVAKFGSGLATQGWMAFTKSFAKPEAIVGTLSAPSSQSLASSIFTAEACRAAYTRMNPSDPVKIRVNAGRHSQPAKFDSSDISFATGKNVSAITYVWTTDTDSGASDPVCGAIEMKLFATPENINVNSNVTMANDIITAMQNGYLSAMGNMVRGVSGGIESVNPGSLTQKYILQSMQPTREESGGDVDAFMRNSDPAVRDAVVNGLAAQMNAMQNTMNSALSGAKSRLSNNGDIDQIQTKMRQDSEQRGWGTAGVYYLEIAKFTQMVLSSVNDAMPKVTAEPVGATTNFLGLRRDTNKQIDAAIKNVGPVITAAVGKSTVTPLTSNPNEEFASAGSLTDPLAWIAKFLFGNSFFLLLDEPTLNPMQALIRGGSDILNRVQIFFWIFVVTQIGGGIAGAIASASAGALLTIPAGGSGAIIGLVGWGLFSSIAGSLLKIIAALAWFLMLLGAAVGIILFYLLPLLPFMYFFFSVVNWVIEVAEAFISMPLFALSHLRIDGEGLLPQRAFENWLILFGILLRPLMIVVGMIIGSLIFNAGAFYLASIYKYAIFAYNPDATSTATGLDFSKVSGFGIITYLVLYVYMVYLLATSSFKLIDQVPDKMLRWIGGPTPFTGDRPVDLQGMQSMALVGYGALKGASEVKNAIGSNIGDMAKTWGGRGKGPKSGGGAKE